MPWNLAKCKGVIFVVTVNTPTTKMPTCDLLPCSYTSTFSRTYPEAASMVQYNFVLTLFRKPYTWLRFIWLQSCVGQFPLIGYFCIPFSFQVFLSLFYFFPLFHHSLFLAILSLSPKHPPFLVQSLFTFCFFSSWPSFTFFLSFFSLFPFIFSLSHTLTEQLWCSDLLFIFVKYLSSYSFWDTVLILYIKKKNICDF